ncbi:isoprenylcysteine carboxyl methyltransferase family protein [Rhizobium sp. PL01]|uniref:isoprenylcysteine carboxyl methyltransferase family protein n=1 Tax=Rhizobium sp. PL01 TaxID=3085631 RepID=UPI0029827300|nr:isoprenylcysteine carboxylmethyltransferase family protein [Rhizobium sp. PL01]MDW5317515.1 isoprenylcysteine carboxylmethyltransferase family protein [Rhizobium sp. PL01]
MIWSILLLTAVTVERLGELWLAKSNTQALMARGAIEVAAAHYPAIVVLHATWLVGLWLLAWDAPLHMGWVTVFAGLQVLRLWTLSTLGRRWTTRIIVVSGERLVTAGPYRLLRHPNYVVVIGEIAVLPLCFDMPLYALIFSVVNAVVLTIRIRAENAALSGLSHAEQA